MAIINPVNFENRQLDIDSLPRYRGVELSSLNQKYLIKLNIITSADAILFFIGLGITYSLMETYKDLFPFLAILVLLIFSGSYYRNFQVQKRNGYAIRERDIIFKRGFIYKKTTIVPFNRVQHVSIERDFPDKILGISTLRLFTAGGSGSDISIPGLIPQIANNMKEEISKRISSDE